MGATFMGAVGATWVPRSHLLICHSEDGAANKCVNVNVAPLMMTRWLNQGVIQERGDSAFRERINDLDQRISAAVRNIR
jgi:hypothetical protein